MDGMGETNDEPDQRMHDAAKSRTPAARLDQTMSHTALFTHEKTFWHTSGMPYAFTVPAGEWVQPLTSGMSDTPESKRRLLSLIEVTGLENVAIERGAHPITEEDARRIHTDHYLSEFKRLSDAQGGDLGVAAPFARGGYDIALLSAGLAKAAVDSVLSGIHRTAYALSRPAGHHALADRPRGMCLLANIPIAIEAARVKHGLSRVAVVDWDVHHGNGAQDVYYNDPNTLTVSLHQERNMPIPTDSTDYRGGPDAPGSNVNVPLPPGCGHEAYLYAMHKVVDPALRRFRPDLIVLACGFDASAIDPMGRMLLHSESYRSMTQHLVDIAGDVCGSRLVAVHEGGYSEVYVPFCGLAVIETLAGTRSGVEDPILNWIAAKQPTPRFLRFQKNWIDEAARTLQASSAE